VTSGNWSIGACDASTSSPNIGRYWRV
jgi:hypothetical protein